MDTSSQPRRTVGLILEVSRTPDNRIEGLIRPDGTDDAMSFSGVLELLKVLEDLA
jgi:hypothetical protein